MNRLTDNDKHIGRFITYGKSNTERTSVILTSGYDNDAPNDHNSYNKLYINVAGYAIRILLPNVIKPFEVKVIASTWTEKQIEQMGRTYYYEYFDRSYGFCLIHDYLALEYGIQNDCGMNFPKNVLEQRTSFTIPWREKRLVADQVFDGHQQLIWDDIAVKKELGDKALDRYETVNKAYKRSYLIKEKDGTEVIVDVHQEYREWKTGTGYFKWMSLFTKPIRQKTLRFDFRSEVGPRKGSWKGGMRGTAFKMLENESFDDCVRRFFATKSVDDRDLAGCEYIKRLT